MTLIRLLIIALAVWILVVLIRNHRVKNKDVKPKPTSRSIDTMVPCAQCDTHVPEKEAIRQDDAFFCSVECLRNHEQQNH